MTKGKESIFRRMFAVLLIVFLSVFLMPAQAGFAETRDEGGYPIREAHKVKVAKTKYCAFVSRNVVLTPSEISKMTDNELVFEILKQSGFYMKPSNCNKPGVRIISALAWVKKGGSFALSGHDLDRLRDASPSDGKPVKLHMNVRISPDPYVEEEPEEEQEPEEKPEAEPETPAEDEQGDKPSTEPENPTDDDQGDKPSTDDQTDKPGTEPETPTDDGQGDKPSTDDQPGNQDGTGTDDQAGTQDGTGTDDQTGTQDGTGTDDQSGTQDGTGTDNQAGTQEGTNSDDQSGTASTDDKSGEQDQSKQEKSNSERRMYSTFKLFSPELLFVVVATKSDAKLSEDSCGDVAAPVIDEPESEEVDDEDDADDDEKEPKELLPEFRTISMTDRSGMPLESPLQDGTPVTLTWKDPAKHTDHKRSPLFYLGGLAILAAAAAAVTAVVRIRRRRAE